MTNHFGYQAVIDPVEPYRKTEDFFIVPGQTLEKEKNPVHTMMNEEVIMANEQN